MIIQTDGNNNEESKTRFPHHLSKITTVKPKIFFVILTLINVELVQQHVSRDEHMPHDGIWHAGADVPQRGRGTKPVSKLDKILFQSGTERSVQSVVSGGEGLSQLFHLMLDSTQGFLAFPPGVVHLGEFFLHLLETVTGLAQIWK